MSSECHKGLSIPGNPPSDGEVFSRRLLLATTVLLVALASITVHRDAQVIKIEMIAHNFTTYVSIDSTNKPHGSYYHGEVRRLFMLDFKAIIYRSQLFA